MSGLSADGKSGATTITKYKFSMVPSPYNQYTGRNDYRSIPTRGLKKVRRAKIQCS
jgi:hypothetical protein